METKTEKRVTWSGQFSFVLAASASAIGLGNLWRFPYLAAQYGGGIFIVIYLALVVTLGFTLMLSEIAIGRKAKQSQLMAYAQLSQRWRFLGGLGMIVALLILPYYCVIGGWVLNTFVAYGKMALGGSEVMGPGAAQAETFFKAFVSDPFAPFGYGLLFFVACALVVALGVKRGIEKVNRVLMPCLLFLFVALAIYVICLPGTGDGIRYYLIPRLDSFSGKDGSFSVALLGKTILGAMGQMFYSLSLAMGIMVTYGSYLKQTDRIETCARRIEIFDTLVAFLSGLMIVPVVYLFAVKNGLEVKAAMSTGPSLMFVTLPKVFATLGAGGAWIGLVFFLLVIFAAATSAISLFEVSVASICDVLLIGRRAATLLIGGTVCFLMTFSALGFGPWQTIRFFDLSFLDFFDFITNSVLMPILAFLTCLFIGWAVKPKVIIDECEVGGQPMKSKHIYQFMVRYLAPLLVLAILISEVCRVFKIGGWSI